MVAEYVVLQIERGGVVWNKAVFSLYPDGKVDMEYIWDAEWQAKIDRYNAEAEAEKQKNRGK